MDSFWGPEQSRPVLCVAMTLAHDLACGTHPADHHATTVSSSRVVLNGRGDALCGASRIAPGTLRVEGFVDQLLFVIVRGEDIDLEVSFLIVEPFQHP
jgi:hypothetical protein